MAWIAATSAVGAALILATRALHIISTILDQYKMQEIGRLSGTYSYRDEDLFGLEPDDEATNSAQIR